MRRRRLYLASRSLREVEPLLICPQFMATASGEGLLWRMDGKPLGRGQRLAWSPWPGRHVVQITNAQGRVLDEIRLEVRGAGVVAAPPKGAAAH